VAMLNEILAQVLAWLETWGIDRITRIWRPVSIVCLILTVILDWRVIYLENHSNCHAMLNGKPIPSNAKWAILCFSTLFVLQFLSARTFYRRSVREDDALNFEQYEMRFMLFEWSVGRPTRWVIYLPLLIICVLTLAPPVLAALLYWKTATSSSCI
jgi:hypothetical protein